MFDGVDARSGVGRRYRDLCRAYEAEAGGGLSVIGRTLIKQAASLTVRCEQMQADLLNGKPVSCDEIVRMPSEIRRILAAVTNKPGRNQAAMPSLQDYIASKYAQPADEDEPV
jgi:hypothetical protein